VVAAAEDTALNEAGVASRNKADTRFTEKFFSDNDFRGRLTREARRAVYQMIRRRHALPSTT
jgi:type I restriction enzyme, R subunit